MRSETTYGEGICTKDSTGLDSYFSRPTTASPEVPEAQTDFLYDVTRQAIKDKFQTPFSDITDRLAQDTYVAVSKITPAYGSRKDLLDAYKKQRMQFEVVEAKGNLTEVTRRLHGVTDPDKVNNLRRNVYRNVDMQAVNYARPWKQQQADQADNYKTPIASDTIESTLRNSLSSYKNDLHPTVYDDLSAQISRYSPQLAEDLGKYVQTNQSLMNDWVDTTKGMTLHESIQYVERDIIRTAMENAGFDKAKAAKYLKDSRETLNRRIRELGMKEELEVVKKQSKTEDSGLTIPQPASDISAIERMRQIKAEKNRSLEAETRKPKKTDQKKVNFPVFEEYIELAA